MKTRTKTLALVEILVVLCSMLLVATLPVIATASEDDFTLGIYGNANEDDIIDMRDTTYIKLVIFGKKPKTKLADANNDGKISMLDVGQTKLIILGKEKELTIVDSAERIVTVKKPVNRVVLVGEGPHEPMIILAKDKIVGISDETKRNRPDIIEKSGLMDTPSVGSMLSAELNYEKILSLEPDLVLVAYWVEDVADKLPEGIPVVALAFDQAGPEIICIEELHKLGAILEEEEEEKANEVINWIQKYEGIIEDRTEGLTLEEKQTFYIETYGDHITYGSNAYDGLVAAGCGGRNIVDEVDIPAGIWGQFEVSPEWVLEQDPDVIFRRVHGGFGWTNEDAEARLNELLARPGWKELSAVKEGRVYLYDVNLIQTLRYIIGRCYFAKRLQPDLFNDLDPESMHKEYWKKFLGVDLEGVWVYPPLK